MMNNITEHIWFCPECGTDNIDIYELTAEPMCSQCSNTYSWDDIGFYEIANALNTMANETKAN